MTKKQLLKTIDEFGGGMFFTHELAFVEGADYILTLRHCRELAKAGKLHCIKHNGKKESDVWCSNPEPVGFVTDVQHIRFGLRLDK